MNGRRIRVRGQVQGVGFRPFVWQLARRFGLKGTVLNDPEGVLVFASGEDLEQFEAAIAAEAPPLARVDAVESEPCDVRADDGFEIVASEGAGAETRVTPDAATCQDCLCEINDVNDRRYGYAFANCTHCGPRFTILKALPYDRDQTTMAPFDMCSACREEYGDPGDRRFHAQPVACPDCGPRVWIEPSSGGDAIVEAAARLRLGEVLAIKGLGGFHLAVDACNADAVALLRDRKRRPGKPFALMGTLEVVCRYASVSKTERVLLQDVAAPIVLLRKGEEALPEGVAPGQASLGWMLPYTPLHHLLLQAFEGPLVMTSGNLSGEPQVIGNAEAIEKLENFADAFVMHDRDIARRLDDSVERITPHGPMVLRRARGRVPGTLPLPEGFENAPHIAAYGGQMKAAICLIKNGQALLGHHLGELDEALTWDAFVQADADYADLFDHHPEAVACDLHPDFSATKHSYSKGLPVETVQHHHAHLAACLGENGWPLEGGKVAGIILDGLGLGPDGTVWGGEVLLGDYRGFERTHWLRQAPLPGGDMAQRDPWRNLLMRLDQAGMADLADQFLGVCPVDLLRQSVTAGVNAPMSSSAGRLFDAFAAALELVAGAQSFEGEAAMRLEALALEWEADVEGYPFDVRDGEIDPAPLFRAWLQDRESGVEAAKMARRFHVGIASVFGRCARELVESGRAKAIALSGGCFQNALLLDLVARELQDLPVLIHTKTPANDGGLALGQALVAAARWDGRRA
ncbi:carbamoyltransferase HypF [Shimia aestuarii]|uniref:Carbamoyltransferase HypF n=1 Tax=Shimia aestuarii TaxID=254406 RepID=A0A1I4Q098_9RHOB|nr:carbamoyltransferase HypF [Shimia aestuarii]SFM33073.1 Hydrogenase maturation protein, carbamoyltransferase HypF [Shimia aestuarii]